jgi:hypothetical protein
MLIAIEHTIRALQAVVQSLPVGTNFALLFSQNLQEGSLQNSNIPVRTRGPYLDKVLLLVLNLDLNSCIDKF